jgi:hypothetical protein
MCKANLVHQQVDTYLAPDEFETALPIDILGRGRNRYPIESLGQVELCLNSQRIRRFGICRSEFCSR